MVSADYLAYRNNKDNTIAHESIMFLMAITVAHELVHLFVGLLTGYIEPTTPPDVTYIAEHYNKQLEDGTFAGESGRAWESLMFGGTVEVYEDEDHSLGFRQSGAIYLIDPQRYGRQIDHECVRLILRFDYGMSINP